MVEVISPTKQRYRGEDYYLCGFYFQRAGVRLHRKVYADLHGPIPKGYDVHHCDANRSNNEPENLVLMAEGKHKSLHASTPERREMSRRCVRFAIAKAPEWHKSKEGHEWHKQHYEKMGAALYKKGTFICEWCGKEYTAVIASQGNKFCSGRCSHAARVASGVDDEDRTCTVCGKVFRCNKYEAKKYCSSECRKANHQARRVLRKRA